MGNTEPIEIIWAYIFSVAFGNFATELQECIQQLRRLNRSEKAGETPHGEASSLRIQAWRNIGTQALMMGVCLFLAIPGWVAIIWPPITRNPVQSKEVFLSSLCIIIAGCCIVGHSFKERYFCRHLNANLLRRKRRGDPPESLDHLLRGIDERSNQW